MVAPDADVPLINAGTQLCAEAIHNTDFAVRHLNYNALAIAATQDVYLEMPRHLHAPLSVLRSCRALTAGSSKLRIAKLLKFGRTRTNVGVDVYNLFNSNVALGYVTTYGATWRNPNSVLDARFAKVSAQFDF